MAATTEGHQFRVIGTRPIRHDGVEKVTGAARYGADYAFPGMLFGRVLRSPHAHAIVKSIKTEKALKLPGVKAIVTGADLPELPDRIEQGGELPINLHHLSCNILARGKVLYDGHAIAAVAATSPHIAEEALRLIEVEYEVLPPVMTVEDAMKPGAPILLPTLRNKEDGPDKQTNVAAHVQFKRGDVDDGFSKADYVVEHELQDRDGPSGVYRAAQRGRYLQLRRPCHHLLLDPGQLRGALAERRGARDSRGQNPRRAGRDRRRLRRQDHDLPRAAVGAALAEDRPSGEDDDEPRRGVARERPDLRRHHPLQDGRDQGRQDRSGRDLDGVRGGRLSGIAGADGRDVYRGALRHPQHRDRRVRRGRQPAQDRGLPRAGRDQRRVCVRDDHQRTRREMRHRPVSTSASKTALTKARRRPPDPRTSVSG